MNRIIKLLNYAPYLFVIIFYSYVLRARIELGYFPRYNQPDPKDLGFNIHHDLVVNSFGISALLCFLNLIVISTRLYRRIADLRSLAVFLLGVLIIIYIITVDPFMEWFAD